MNRSVLAALATASVLVLSSCTGDPDAATPGTTPTAASPSPTALPTASPLPTSTVTPRAVPSPAATGTTTVPTPPPRRETVRPTPQASPAAPSDIPGALGTVPAGFALPDEDRPADGENSAFTTTVWRASCPDRVLTLASASGLTASRIKESIGPEYTVGNGLLVFRDEAAATAFVEELRTALGGCAENGPDEDGWRTVQASGPIAAMDADGVEVRQWSQWNAGETWVEAPGALLQYVARKGANVVLTYEGGEYVSDPGASDELRAELAHRIGLMLDQL